MQTEKMEGKQRVLHFYANATRNEAQMVKTLLILYFARVKIPIEIENDKIQIVAVEAKQRTNMYPPTKPSKY